MGSPSWQTTRLSEAWGLNIGAQAGCRCKGPKAGPVPLVRGRVSRPSRADTGHLIVCGRELPVHLGMFSSIPGLYLPETRSSLPGVIIRKVSRYCQLTIPWGANLPPLEKPGSSRHSMPSAVRHPSSKGSLEAKHLSWQNGCVGTWQSQAAGVSRRRLAAGSRRHGSRLGPQLLGAPRPSRVRWRLI